jgi:hypothetical protein
MRSRIHATWVGNEWGSSERTAREGDAASIVCTGYTERTRHAGAAER